MKNKKKSQTREQALVRMELHTWEALIGADGSPAIQKFAIQQRLYAFARTAVNISCEDPKREMRQAQYFIKMGAGKKIKQFIDFIEGDLSMEDAQKIKAALHENLLDANIVQLANA